MKYLIPLSIVLLCCLPQLRAEISVSLADSVSCVCEGNPQQAFEVVATGSAGPFTFEWMGPEGYSSTDMMPTDIEIGGTYTLMVTNAYECTFEYQVEAPACPQPQLEYTPTPTSPCVENGGITATFIEGASDYHSFEWYEEGGASTGVQGLELSDVGAGFYYLSMMDNNGCAFQSPLLEIEQLQAPAMEVVEAVIGDVCGVLDIVEDNSFRVSSVYPNPFQDELTIKLTASYDGKATIRMVNLLGQTVHLEEQTFIRGYNPLTLSTAGPQWQTGIYHLIVTDEKQNQFTEKVILQR